MRDRDGRGIWMKAGPGGFDEVTESDVILVDAGARRRCVRRPRALAVRDRVRRDRPAAYAFSSGAEPFVRDGVARFERAVGLIDSPGLGSELAQSLGAARAALLVAHGTIAVGSSVATAATTASLLERACRWPILATAGGGIAPAYRDPGERYAHTESDRYLMRSWDYVLRRARTAEARLGADRTTPHYRP